MDCDQLVALIHHYLDGGLSQWRHRAVTKHIVECPPCAVEHRFHVHYRQVVATKCSEEVPFIVRSRICEALISADPAFRGPELRGSELRSADLRGSESRSPELRRDASGETDANA
jgi:mycothiol system anti-sigma-R factor